MKTIKEIETFGEFLSKGFSFSDCCFQSIDFTIVEINWERLQFSNCLFLGCIIPPHAVSKLSDEGCLVFPRINGLPYDVYRSRLYTWKELYAKSSDSRYQTLDEEIYHHFTENRHNGNISNHLYQYSHLKH